MKNSTIEEFLFQEDLAESKIRNVRPDAGFRLRKAAELPFVSVGVKFGS